MVSSVLIAPWSRKITDKRLEVMQRPSTMAVLSVAMDALPHLRPVVSRAISVLHHPGKCTAKGTILQCMRADIGILASNTMHAGRHMAIGSQYFAPILSVGHM
jgi:hypothetical protein